MANQANLDAIRDLPQFRRFPTLRAIRQLIGNTRKALNSQFEVLNVIEDAANRPCTVLVRMNDKEQVVNLQLMTPTNLESFIKAFNITEFESPDQMIRDMAYEVAAITERDPMLTRLEEFLDKEVRYYNQKLNKVDIYKVVGVDHSRDSFEMELNGTLLTFYSNDITDDQLVMILKILENSLESNYYIHSDYDELTRTSSNEDFKNLPAIGDTIRMDTMDVENIDGEIIKGKSVAGKLIRYDIARNGYNVGLVIEVKNADGSTGEEIITTEEYRENGFIVDTDRPDLIRPRTNLDRITFPNPKEAGFNKNDVIKYLTEFLRNTPRLLRMPSAQTITFLEDELRTLSLQAPAEISPAYPAYVISQNYINMQIINFILGLNVNENSETTNYFNAAIYLFDYVKEQILSKPEEMALMAWKGESGWESTLNGEEAKPGLQRTNEQIDLLIKSDTLIEKEPQEMNLAERVASAYKELNVQELFDRVVPNDFTDPNPGAEAGPAYELNIEFARRFNALVKKYKPSSMLDRYEVQPKEYAFGDRVKMSVLFVDTLGNLLKPEIFRNNARLLRMRAQKMKEVDPTLGTPENPFRFGYETNIGLAAVGKGTVARTAKSVFSDALESASQSETIEQSELYAYMQQKSGPMGTVVTGTYGPFKSPKGIYKTIWGEFATEMEEITSGGIYLNGLPPCIYALDYLRQFAGGCSVVEGDVFPFNDIQAADLEAQIAAIQEEFNAAGLSVEFTRRNAMISRLPENKLQFIVEHESEAAEATGRLTRILKVYDATPTDYGLPAWPRDAESKDIEIKFNSQLEYFQANIVPDITARIKSMIDNTNDERERNILTITLYLAEDYIACATKGLPSRLSDTMKAITGTDKTLEDEMRDDDFARTSLKRAQSAMGGFKYYLGTAKRLRLVMISNAASTPYPAVMALVEQQFDKADPAYKYFVDAYNAKTSET